jgi:NNP family nitrate/nitrite transporter-like MFS transporter
MKAPPVERPGNPEGVPSFRSQLPPIFFLVEIFFLNFVSRIVLSPLLPTIEKDLKIGHEKAGSLFFLISLGYCIMLLGSSFVSSRLNHRRTIILSTVVVGGALLFVGLSRQFWMIRIGLFALGLAAGLYLPSGIATLTELANPRHWGKAVSRNIAVSLTMPVGFLIGGGVIPAMIGVVGQARSFSSGFMILGGVLAGGAFLVRYLKFAEN